MDDDLANDDLTDELTDELTDDELGWPSSGPDEGSPAEQLRPDDAEFGCEPPGRRQPPSQVFSVRLGHDEVAHLRERAGDLRIEPSVLARAFIRRGLIRLPTDAVERAVSGMESAVSELRLALL